MFLLLIACETSPPGSESKGGDAGELDWEVPPDTAGDSTPLDTGDSGESGTGGGEPVTLADSITGFSDVQGENGWWYGYIEPDGDNTFVEMASYNYGEPDPGWYAATGGNYWTFIDAETMHPNGETTTGGRLPVEQWAVRRWVSTVDGTVHLSGHLAKMAIDGETNGVNGYVYVDGVMRWAWYIEGWDDGGADLDKDVDVSVGSTVDFILDPRDSDDRSDRSYFYATISQ
ncbi:MAG: hypothetical protein FJ090_08405 [Deltaproteobacteria bacterium]|nr:hypothetical protein [Deltaproteobacteria bacterium]